MKSKNAVITGASRGIGKAVAQKLASEGYNLVLNCNKNSTLLEKTADDLMERYHIKCFCICGDISSDETCKYIYNAIQKVGSVDVLIHCAGISKIGLLSNMNYLDWQELMNTNLNSCFQLYKYISPFMIANKSGRIIFMSSVWGCRGASCEAAYSASKGAVNALTQSLAKELAPSNIAVNALALGMIDTDMNNCFSDKEKMDICNEIPAGRMGTASEVADMCSLLLKAPAYMTGQIINLDGGWQ